MQDRYADVKGAKIHFIEEGKPSKLGINNLNKIYLDKEKVKLSQAYLIMFRNREGYASVSSMIMRKNTIT